MGEMDNSQEEVAMPEVQQIFQCNRAGVRKRTLIFSVWMTVPKCHCLCEHSMTALHFLLLQNYNPISLLALFSTKQLLLLNQNTQKKDGIWNNILIFLVFPLKNHTQKSAFFFSCWLLHLSLSAHHLPWSLVAWQYHCFHSSSHQGQTLKQQSVHHSQGHIWLIHWSL